MKLEREFFLRDGISLARALLGKTLVHRSPEGETRGVIVETEAYMGELDKAAHSYKRRENGRTNIQYREGGHAYIYLIYGMHCCFNITANAADVPECVLIRALEPSGGTELMRLRRRQEQAEALCSGPGKLCAAMGIDRSLYGEDLCGERLFLLDEGRTPDISVGRRINIDYAEEAADFPWRFTVRGSRFLSVREKEPK